VLLFIIESFLFPSTEDALSVILSGYYVFTFVESLFKAFRFIDKTLSWRDELLLFLEFGVAGIIGNS